MKIYIVSKITESLTDPATDTVSAHVDKMQADTAAQSIDHQGRDGIYGVVETVELDLTGMDQGALDELREAVG